MPDSDERQEQILSAAAAVIVRQGYDKTTMGDVAGEAGVSRGTVYLHFRGKEELFEALLYREWMQYARTWLDLIDSDPRGGTLGGIYRATFLTIGRRPLVASMLRRDRRVIGSYLRKRDNLFAWIQSSPLGADLIQALQAAGAVRQDIDPAVTAHIVDLLSYGHLTIEDFKPRDQCPPYETVLEALADMMDRLLTPEGGGNDEAGKEVIRQLVSAARVQLEQARQAKSRKETLES